MSFYNNIKELFIGKTLRSEEINSQKYNVARGLPILASDAISSVAYAGEEILWVLVPVISIYSYKYMFYCAAAIILLLFILVFSYRQTIDNYPNGGGAFIVAKDNLGTTAGLVAGASLSIDYILTVAVSICAGTSAITSAFPAFSSYKVELALLILLLMAIGNLRGIKESSTFFSIPTYMFIITVFIMIIYGLFKKFILGYIPEYPTNILITNNDVTFILLLRAFAAGCTALTGVEAVSNGIPNFAPPSQKNAKKVLILLALIIVVIFGGTSYLATLYYAMPSLHETVISQIAFQVFGKSFMYYFMQITTAGILVMAANTAFSDLPLLLSVIANEGYAPRQFAKRGARLNFSNGIITLSFLASILIIIFKGEAHFLLPLYAVGVFISFTLSQSGMFVKWIKSRTRHWHIKAFINGLGALVTFITAIIIAATKFLHGAWLTLILIPSVVMLMLSIKRHYEHTALQLSLQDKKLPTVSCDRVQHFIVLVGGLNKSVVKAINYAKCLSKDIIAFHISVNDEETEKLKHKWNDYNINIPLIIRKSPYRDILQTLMEYIESEEHPSKKDDIITVVIPQFIVNKWWGNILHNQTALFIKNALLKNRNISIITVPYIIDK